jgi:DNA-binding transcriptional regulator GbsR (MarR family)
MDRPTALFVDGLGAAAATSGILTQLQGRIFALLYLQARPLALEDVAAALGQSKSNVSVNVRGLLEWHLVRRTRVGGSRKDHYEAATDFWRVMQEIMERRFRWNLRQVLAAAAETARALAEERGRRATDRAFLEGRLEALRAFFSAVDAGIGAFAQGRAFAPETVQNVLTLAARPRRERS